MKSAAATKAEAAEVTATNTEVMATNAALAANTAADRLAKAKVAADTPVRSDARVVAKVVVPGDAVKAGVPVVAAGCSVQAI